MTTSFGVREQGDFRLTFFDGEEKTDLILVLKEKQYIITFPLKNEKEKLDSIEKMQYLKYALVEYHNCIEEKIVFGRNMENFYYKVKFSAKDKSITFGNNILTIRDIRHSKVLQEYVGIWLKTKTEKTSLEAGLTPRCYTTYDEVFGMSIENITKEDRQRIKSIWEEATPKMANLNFKTPIITDTKGTSENTPVIDMSRQEMFDEYSLNMNAQHIALINEKNILEYLALIELSKMEDKILKNI